MAGGPFRLLQFNLWWRFLQIFSLFQSYEKIQLLRAGLKNKKQQQKNHHHTTPQNFVYRLELRQDDYTSY